MHFFSIIRVIIVLLIIIVPESLVHNFLFPYTRKSACHKIFDYNTNFIETGWRTSTLPRAESAQIFPNWGDKKEPVVRFELRPNEYAARGKRAELTDPYIPPGNSNLIYKFSTFIPEEFPSQMNNSTVMAQWHTIASFKPPVAVRYRYGRLDITLDHFNRGTPDPKKSGQIRIARIENFRKNVWHDFIFDIKWSAKEDGWVKVFLNQNLIADYRGQTQYMEEADIGAFFKYGVYVGNELEAPIWALHGPYERIHVNCL